MIFVIRRPFGRVVQVHEVKAVLCALAGGPVIADYGSGENALLQDGLKVDDVYVLEELHGVASVISCVYYTS